MVARSQSNYCDNQLIHMFIWVAQSKTCPQSCPRSARSTPEFGQKGESPAPYEHMLAKRKGAGYLGDSEESGPAKTPSLPGDAGCLEDPHCEGCVHPSF